MRDAKASGFVRLRGGREHDLRNVDVDIPRDVPVVLKAPAAKPSPGASLRSLSLRDFAARKIGKARRIAIRAVKSQDSAIDWGAWAIGR